MNGKHCIVITDLFRLYPTISTTLIHELHHVLHDLPKISQAQFHLSGEPGLFLIEDKAGEFAIETSAEPTISTTSSRTSATASLSKSLPAT